MQIYGKVLKVESDKVESWKLEIKKPFRKFGTVFNLCKTYYFLEQHDFFSVEAQDFLSAAFLSEQQDFSVFAFFFSFSFSLKLTTEAEETINAIKATIDNTFFIIFIFICYTY